MKLVATLISSPSLPAVDNFVIGKAATALNTVSSCSILAEGIAADLFFDGNISAVKSHEQVIRLSLGSSPVDIIIQPADNRRKKLFLADMDSTIIQQECIDELADEAGFGEKVATITERAMRGEITFEPALRERVNLLKGLPLAVIHHVLANRIVLTPGAQELVKTMRENGTYTCLVSGGFTAFTESIATRVGFHEHRANVLEAEGDYLSGYVREPILGKAAKLTTLKDLREKLALDKNDTLATGDGANDLDMILEAGTGIAFHAKPAVAEAAPHRIIYGDLTALLYIQGYKGSEFIH